MKVHDFEANVYLGYTGKPHIQSTKMALNDKTEVGKLVYYINYTL